MKRRQFLKYGGLGLAGLSLTACERAKFSLPQLNLGQEQKFDNPEKPNLRIGFVPVLTALPLIVAQEQGFFQGNGLTVQLIKNNNWDEIEQNLRKWQYDSAHSLFSLPLQAQLSSNYSPIISLMMLNLNGSAITLTPKAWKAGIRPLDDFVNFPEFSHSFRKYARKDSSSLKLASSSPQSLENYLMRYWLGSMGIDAQREVEWLTFPAQQMIYKLQAGIIDGFGAAEPWNQQVINQKAGFIPYTYRDIWRGHPGDILATMSPWVEKHPATARALMGSVLKACKYCEDPENYLTIAQIAAQPKYLNLSATTLEPLLGGQYSYEKLEDTEKSYKIPDSHIYHYQATEYLQKPNHANYPWRSHAVWLLTQMVRWQDLGLKTYPKNADQILDKAYPVALYEEVAKALKIPLPSDRLKVEPSTVFVDHREFDPSQPDAYLKQFELRANRPQWFA